MGRVALPPGVEEELEAVLTEGRRRGFLGPGPLWVHIEQALGFGTIAAEVPPSRDAAGGPPVCVSKWSGRLLDLGAGGGVPGLVVAAALPRAEVILLDANQRRADFLESSRLRLGFGHRVTVVHSRAESLAHEQEFRGTFDRVLARSFGPPPVTAECSAAFLRVGGFLVVSEPPEGKPEDRWLTSGLAILGMGKAEQVVCGARFVRIRQNEDCPAVFPRRVGVPSKRSLF
jgi:16S rRNA (guanine527-N7)-methyltransferase